MDVDFGLQDQSWRINGMADQSLKGLDKLTADEIPDFIIKMFEEQDVKIQKQLRRRKDGEDAQWKDAQERGSRGVSKESQRRRRDVIRVTFATEIESRSPVETPSGQSQASNQRPSGLLAGLASCVCTGCVPAQPRQKALGVDRDARTEDPAAAAAAQRETNSTLEAEVLDASRSEDLRRLVALFPAEPVLQLELFLAKYGDACTAAEQLQNHICWCQKYLPVPESEISKQLATQKLFRCGVDLLGRPVLVFVGFRHTPGNVEADIRLLTYWIEDAIASMADGVRDICLMLFLPEGSPLDINFILAAHKLCVAHYPHRVVKALAFPTSWVTGYIWSACQQVLSRDVLDTVCIMPPDGGKKPPELFKHIAADQLLASFGGRIPEAPGRSIEDDFQRFQQEQGNGGWRGNGGWFS
jgi:hypothetical protein